jgi:hypothetical protein
MAFFTGDFSLRAGTADPKTWILREGNNNDPIDLTSVTDIEIRFKSLFDGSTKVFKKSSHPLQVETVGALTDGAVKFTPLITDFILEQQWEFYMILVNGSGPHSIPEGSEYILTVTPKFGS